LADWIFFISNGSSGTVDDGASFKGVDPIVATTLYLGAHNEFEKMKDELDEAIYYRTFCFATSTSSISLSSLDSAQFRKVHKVTKTHYEDFINNRPPRFNMIRPDDEELNKERRKYFDLYMRLLEEDPRMQEDYDNDQEVS